MCTRLAPAASCGPCNCLTRSLFRLLCHAPCRSASGPLVVDWDAAELCLDLLLVVLLRNRDRLPLLWPPVFDHLASIIKGKGVSELLQCLGGGAQPQTDHAGFACLPASKLQPLSNSEP